MPISHLHRPIGLFWLLLILAIGGRQDAVISAAPVVVAFVGQLEAAADPSWPRFRSALVRAWPAGEVPPTLVYHSGGAGMSDQLVSTLRAAAAQRPAVLVLPTGELAATAKALAVDVPVVFASFSNPLAEGVVASLRTPGRQTTGVWLADTVAVKRLQLLKEAFPHVRTVAVLGDKAWFAAFGDTTMTEDVQSTLGLHLFARVAETPQALDLLMSSPEAADCDAWYIPPSYIAYLAEAKIIAALKRLRLPAMHSSDGEIDQGALAAYSQDERFAYDALADLARRVALGEDAGSIPVQRPYRYTLSVRIEPDAPWARIEPSVVRRADRVHRP
jgi:putative tryptophan/tyrosine transport system substrate-binding protein